MRKSRGAEKENARDEGSKMKQYRKRKTVGNKSENNNRKQHKSETANIMQHQSLL